MLAKYDHRWHEVVLVVPTKEGDLPDLVDDEGAWTVQEVVFGFWPADSYWPAKLPRTSLLRQAIVDAVQQVLDQYGIEAVLGPERRD